MGQRGLSLLFNALGSFKANGFDVISVNRPTEIESLKPVFTSTQFVAAEDEGHAIFPKRYGPSIRSVLGACAGYDACAIVNADIFMLGSDITEVMGSNPGIFFAAHRLDVDQIGGDVVGVYRRGVDAVFFDLDRFAALAEDADLGRFQLGAPFWDIVVPILASFHGTLSFIDPPFILHQVHQARWSHADYDLLREAAIRTAVKHAELHSTRSARARVFLQLFDKFVGSNWNVLDRRSIRNAMMIFDLWIAKIEGDSCHRLRVDIDGALSNFAQQRLSAGLGDTPIDPPDLLDRSPAGSVWPQRAKRLAKSAMREWKRRRREKAISVTLAGIDF
jgi:hypothetical protein